MKAVLLDIEGTTSPIDFVHNTLFPYSRARVAGYVQEHFSELRYEMTLLAVEADQDMDYTGTFKSDSANSAADYLKFLIDNDRKSTPLKSIQGKIWEAGYQSGELVSKLYKDVSFAFRRWKEDSILIAIYSSGSIIAQQMLFKYSDQGDMASFITAFFDTETGNKLDKDSYIKIASELNLDASDMVFISDISAELDAASAAGMTSVLSIRPGNKPIENISNYREINTLDQI